MHNQGLNPNDPFNQSLKKSILWNAVEPGDPYDIKKSMIAKLPGDKKIFLGNKLQIVCLLQAAQIQRLALNLEEYKIKLREVEKSDLDRHSYEIQIKELALRLQNEESLRTEITKLKNFIDRLNQQLEQTRQKNTTGNNQLNIKYQQALLQIQNFTEQNTQLSNEIFNIRNLLETRNSQYSQAEITITQLQEDISRYADTEGRIQDYEDKFTLLGKQIQRLNQVLKGKTEQINQLKDLLSQNESYLRSKRQENEYLISSQLKLSEQINLLKAELKRVKNEQDQQRSKDYQSRLEISNQKVNSLNIQLTNQRAQFQIHCDRLRAENDQLRSIIRQLEGHVQQLEDQNEKYQDNSSIIARQIERLNGVLKAKIDQNNTLQARNNRLTEQAQFHLQQVDLLQKQSGELKLIHRRMEQLQFELSNQQAAKQRLAKINSDLVKRQTELDQSTIEQYEIRINHLNQDIKRFNDSIFALQSENKSIREKLHNSELAQHQLRKVSRQLSDLKNLMMQQDANKQIMQQRISDLTRKGSQYQKLMNELSAEIQRLNDMLKSKLQQSTILQNRMQYITGQNHRLQGLLKQQAENQGKIEDYENKFALISLEVERLNNNLKMKLQQVTQLEQHVNNLKKENGRLKQTINQINYKSNHSIQELNEQIRRQIFQKDEELNKLKSIQVKYSEVQIQLQKINQILKQKLDEIKEKDVHLYKIQSECQTLRAQLRQARNKQKQISDLQRLNNLLRLKVEEAARWESSNHQLIKQNEAIQINFDHALQDNSNLTNELYRANSEINSLVSQLNQYKEKVSQILRQFERLQQMLESFRKDNGELKQENYELKLQLSSGNLKQKNHRLLQEIQRLKVIIQQQKQQVKELRLILSQDHAFEKRIRQQLSLIVILCAEIQTLRKRVEDKQKQVEDVRRQSLVPLKA